jgi:acylphosphatase
MTQQRIVHFQGHVQGVGFRQTTFMLAQRFAVRGYVQNLPDGRVKLAMVGTRDEMDRFEKAIDERLGGFIRDRLVDVLPANEDFSEFKIRY